MCKHNISLAIKRLQGDKNEPQNFQTRHSVWPVGCRSIQVEAVPRYRYRNKAFWPLTFKTDRYGQGVTAMVKKWPLWSGSDRYGQGVTAMAKEWPLWSRSDRFGQGVTAMVKVGPLYRYGQGVQRHKRQKWLDDDNTKNEPSRVLIQCRIWPVASLYERRPLLSTYFTCNDRVVTSTTIDYYVLSNAVEIIVKSIISFQIISSIISRKLSIAAGIRRNEICYNTCNET